MVHISDGILSTDIWVSGFIITIGILLFTLSKVKSEEIPKLSLIAGALFIASLVHVPIGPSSTHLILGGLAGIVLGFAAFPAVFIAVLLQALMFQHGGITTIGINSLTIGIPALITAGIFWIGTNHTKSTKKFLIVGSISGGIAVTLALLFTSLTLYFTGEEFIPIIYILIISHIPVIIIETFLIGSVSEFLYRVKPEMLSWAITSNKNLIRGVLKHEKGSTT